MVADHHGPASPHRPSHQPPTERPREQSERGTPEPQILCQGVGGCWRQAGGAHCGWWTPRLPKVWKIIPRSLSSKCRVRPWAPFAFRKESRSEQSCQQTGAPSTWAGFGGRLPFRWVNGETSLAYLPPGNPAGPAEGRGGPAPGAEEPWRGPGSLRLLTFQVGRRAKFSKSPRGWGREASPPKHSGVRSPAQCLLTGQTGHPRARAWGVRLLVREETRASGCVSGGVCSSNAAQKPAARGPRTASWGTELKCGWRAVPRSDGTGKGEQVWGVNVNILSQGRPGFSAEGPLWEGEGEGCAPPAEPLPPSQPWGARVLSLMPSWAQATSWGDQLSWPPGTKGFLRTLDFPDLTGTVLGPLGWRSPCKPHSGVQPPLHKRVEAGDTSSAHLSSAGGAGRPSCSRRVRRYSLPRWKAVLRG